MFAKPLLRRFGGVRNSKLEVFRLADSPKNGSLVAFGAKVRCTVGGKRADASLVILKLVSQPVLGFYSKQPGRKWYLLEAKSGALGPSGTCESRAPGLCRTAALDVTSIVALVDSN